MLPGFQFFNIYLFIYYVYNILSAGQKRTPDPITDGCEPPCGCRDSNSGPREKQAVLLTTEPFLQPFYYYFYSIQKRIYVFFKFRDRVSP